MPSRAYLPRDERGWRIPRPGTVAHNIYALMVLGKNEDEIAAWLNKRVGNIHMVVYRIKKPEKHNRYGREYNDRKRLKSKGVGTWTQN